MGGPSLPRKIAFWLLLGLVSTAFAEVPFPGTPFDLVALATQVGPIYLLHAVVLGGLVFGADRVTFPTLYLGGAVLGLYETYVTKVAWAPVGDPLPVRVAGVHPVETLSLVLFWHPLMAFVLPVAAVEVAATDSRLSPATLADHRYARPLAVAGLVGLAAFHGTFGGGPTSVAAASAGALVVLLGALGAWRLTGGHRFEMRALLPAGRELWVLGVALATLYLVLGVALRPDALPERLLPHVVVLALYVVVGGLFLVALRLDGGSAPLPASTAGEFPATSVAFTWPRALGMAAAFVVASAVAAVVLAPLATLVFVAYFAVSVLAGAGILVAVVLELRQA